MKSVWKAAFVLGFSLTLFAAEKPDSTEKTPDVQTIVNKANIVAYYQGEDGKAKVKMTITSKQGQKRLREFNILRKDVTDGGDQKYFIYFQRPADVRRMTFMVLKHADTGKDDDRWLYLPALSLVKRIAGGDKRTSFVGSDFLYEDVSGRSLAEDTHELIETTDQFFIVIRTTIAAEIIKQKPQLQVKDFGSFTPLKSTFSPSLMSAGSASSVTAPDNAMIAHRNIPTVL